MARLKKIRVALIGYGYWGPNIARNIALNPSFDLAFIVEKDEKRRAKAASDFNSTVIAMHTEIDLEDKLDLVVICTRPSTHLDLARFFATITDNILLMKPSGGCLDDAIKINDLGNSSALNIYCDFTYIFSPIINYVYSNPMCREVLSEMTEYNSYRTSLGIVQADVNVLADLAVHDISILIKLKDSLPERVNCLRTDNDKSDHIKSAFLTLTWKDGFKASIHVGWNSPKKVRQISIMGNGRAILIEELSKEAPLQIMHFKDNSVDYANLSAHEKMIQNVSYYLGDTDVPKFEQYESLSMEISCLEESIKRGAPKIIFPTSAVAVTIWQILNALEDSAKNEGSTTYVKY